MAIIGVVTNTGILKVREAQLNEGFRIAPSSFGVSRVQDPLDPNRTVPNAGQWYQGLISSRVVVSDTTLKFICTIPVGSIPPATTDIIREIYIYCLDSLNVPFLFVIGRPSSDIIYDPDGTVTLELEISLTNASLTNSFIFNYTQATELSEHNTDPTAHPDILDAMNRAGQYLTAGATPFEYSGQNYDEKAEFAGTKSTATYGGKTFTAAHNGTAGNSITLVFDGIKSVNQVIAVWNNANPRNTVNTNAVGSEVLSAGSVTLSTGTTSVNNLAPVYRDTDGIYKMAVDDGTIRSKVAGLADTTKRIVRGGGFLKYVNAYAIGTELWLSTVTPGAVVTTPTRLKLATVMETGASGFVEVSTFGGGSSGISQSYDTVVSDSPGFNYFTTTQAAIAATPDGGAILIDKLEQLTASITTSSKAIRFVFNGPTKGWTRSLGTAEAQKISFASVPTSGTFRIEWNGNETTDLPYNASAGTVQTAFLLLPGVPVGTTVTGNFTIGFTINYSTFVDFPEPTFISPGVDESQLISFSGVPDNGTFKIDFAGQQTINIPWNATPANIETYLENLSNINDVNVSGSFAAGFTVTFVNADGKSNQPLMTIVSDSLVTGITAVTINVTTPVPGKTPASNLKNGINPVAITATTLAGGSPVGPGTCITVTKDKTQFLGKGTISNFTSGIDLNGHSLIDIDVIFDTVATPIVHSGIYAEEDYHRTLSYGFDSQRVLIVGTPGDYNDIDSAYSAANDGDKIQVLIDQNITSAKVWNKNIEIEFVRGAKLIAAGAIVGTIITLGNQVKTRHLHLLVSIATTYTNALLYTGPRGHHINTILEASGNTTVITNGFVLDATADSVYIDGAVLYGTATLTNILVNNTGLTNCNVVIRDKDNGITHDVFNRRPPIQETPTGAVNGANAFFTLSTPAASADSILVMVDGIPRFKTIAWILNSPTQIQFQPGYIPTPGQDVYVYFLPSGLLTTPPTAKAGAVEVKKLGVTIQSNGKILDFGSGFNVTNTGPDTATITSTGGGGGGSWNVEYHTITSGDFALKQFNMIGTPFDPTLAIVDVVEGGPKIPSEDYVISGTLFSWSGLGLDGLIAIGHRVRIAYFS